MKDEEILAGAPDESTSYSAKRKQYWDWPKRTVKPFDIEHLDTDYPDDLRSLFDIQTIVELRKQIVELEQVIENDYRESSSYALSIYNNYYKQKPSAVTFELCDTSAGVVTQIDNMVTGVIAELEQNLGLVRVALDHQKTLLVSCEAALSERDTKIAELEKELNLTKDIIVAHQIADETGYIDGIGWVSNWAEMNDEVIKLLESHNLEQQAKGVEEFVERYCGTSIELEHEAIRVCAAQQAKQLREGKK